MHVSIGAAATRTQIRLNEKANEKNETVIRRCGCLEGEQLSEEEKEKSLIPVGPAEHKRAVVEVEGSKDNSVDRMRYGAVHGFLVFGVTRTTL